MLCVVGIDRKSNENEERDAARAIGTSIGLDGPTTVIAWFHRKSIARQFDRVAPATGRGTLRVLAWIAAVAAITLGGRLLVPSLGGWWLAIALAVMVPVGLRWPTAHEPTD
jgi:hypothetical protein